MKTKILFWLCVFTGMFGQNFYYMNEDFTNVSPGDFSTINNGSVGGRF